MVKVFSSSRSRSLISAISHNHGLFPSGTRWNPEVKLSDAMKSMTKQLPNWNGTRESNIKQKIKNEFFSEPIAVPLETTEQFEDLLFLPRIDKACPNAKPLREQYRHEKLNHFNPQIKDYVQSILDQLHKALPDQKRYDFFTALMLNSTSSLNHFYDLLISSYSQNGKMPANLSLALFEKVRKAASFYFMLKFGKDSIARLYTHQLSQNITKLIQARVEQVGLRYRGEASEGHPGYMYVGFSGDDDNIAALLNLFTKTSY